MTDSNRKETDTDADVDTVVSSRARLAAIVDSSDDAIISKTLQGVVTSWNRSAERIFGWTAQEAIGQNIKLIIPKERDPEEEDVLARIGRGESVDHFETVRVAKDGGRVDISLTVSPIRNEAGVVIGASKIARDITPRRRMEAERERLLLSERNARLQAEAVNRAKDVFLATVSHELRTPLNAIFGWARILESTEVDEATRKHAIEAIVRNSSAQAQLIEDLLDLSRIVTGRMRLDLEQLQLPAVIEAAVDSLRPTAAAKGVTLTTELDESAGTIVGAPDRLQQVVWNLVVNAIKFTPRGGRIVVTLRKQGDSAEIVVADTGEGISAQWLPFVFDRFQQEDSSSTRVHGGLGLGLSLVQHLVELHGGGVRAESPGKGQGATFTIALPLVMSDPVAEVKETHLAAGGNGPNRRRTPLRDLRVLVVDDDPEALDLASMILRGDGAEVRVAGSAVRALEIVKTWEPEVLVSDLAMPGEDGFMLLRALRSDVVRGKGRLPAIAVTAFETPENRMKALETGFDLYLTKPVDPLQLSEAVAEIARRAA